MTPNPQPTPTVEELQKQIAELTSKVQTLESKEKELDDLKTKHADLVATNMRLINMIPQSGGTPEEKHEDADISAMSDDERYDYLKALAKKGM